MGWLEVCWDACLSLGPTLCHYLGLLPWGLLPGDKKDYRFLSPFSRDRAEGEGNSLQLQATGIFQPPPHGTAVYRVLQRGKIREREWVEARYV